MHTAPGNEVNQLHTRGDHQQPSSTGLITKVRHFGLLKQRISVSENVTALSTYVEMVQVVPCILTYAGTEPKKSSIGR